MLDLKSFGQAIEQIAEEKGISKEKVLETIEMAVAAAYKKDYGKRGQIVRAKLDPKTGKMEMFQIKIVVDEDMIKSEEEIAKEEAEEGPEPKRDYDDERVSEGDEKIRFNEEKHIMLADAKKKDKKVKVGDEIQTKLEPHEDFGRIAAQTAKQVIIQRIREAEREAVFGEFHSKEGELVSGMVQRVEGRAVFLDLGKAVGLMLPQEQIAGEVYRMGLRFKAFLLKVEDSPKGPVIYLSRAHPKMISRLFELEVPEISAGTVVIKSVAREPGSRTKVAVASEEDGVDPIGSCVGQKGTRVSTVINELGGEKIDIIEWNEKPEEFIAHALSPAKVLHVDIDTDKNQAIVMVPEDQLSLAIGKEGQNVRLAAKLTGWKIDVRSSEEGSKKEKGPPSVGEKKEDTREKGAKKPAIPKASKPRAKDSEGETKKCTHEKRK